MSESLYICAASLCCCLAVCSLVRIISPSGNTTKILSLVVGVFALCCLISPFATLAKDINIDGYKRELDIKNSDLSDVYDKEILRNTGEYINSYAQALLISADINPLNVKTIISVNESRGIFIKELNIYINKNSSYREDDIKSLIETALGVVPKITEI